MIIGNGDIASVLPREGELLFFASGVSNSQETRVSEYRREEDLLMSQDHLQHIVYFSSLSIFYKYDMYQRHKRKMEHLVKNFFSISTIIRIGNIDWGDNPHTLINFMRNQVVQGDPVQIHDGHRYILTKEEFLHWITLIPHWSCEMNITGKMMTIEEVFNTYVRHYGNT